MLQEESSVCLPKLLSNVTSVPDRSAPMQRGAVLGTRTAHSRLRQPVSKRVAQEAAVRGPHNYR